MRLPNVLVVLLSLALIVPGCTPGAENEATPSRTGGGDNFVSDARFLVERMRSIHPKLFHSLSRTEFERAALDLEESALALDRDAFMVEVARFVASTSSEGRDGHTGVFIFDQSEELDLEMLPLRLYAFSDGVYVVDALEPYRSLIGGELLSIGGIPIEDAIENVRPMISKDNDMTVLSRLPWFLVWMEALQVTEVLDPEVTPTMDIRIQDDQTVIQQVEPVPMEAYAEWADIWHPMIPARLPTDEQVLYLRNADKDIWLKYLRAEEAVYLQYNAVTVGTSSVARRLTELARKHPDAEIIVDLRHNPGGDIGTSARLSAAFRRSPLRDREVIVLAGRGTFSAASIFLARLQQVVDPVVIGEATGGALNFFGDPVAVRLFESDVLVEVSGIHWTSPRRDERLTYEPDVAVELSAADFFAHRDPVLDEALKR